MALENSALALERCAQHEAKQLSSEHEAKMHEAPVVPLVSGPASVPTKESQQELGNVATSRTTSTCVRHQQSGATILLQETELEGAVRWTSSCVGTDACKGKTARSLSPPSRRRILVEEGQIVFTPRTGQGMFAQNVSGVKLEEPDDTSSVRRVPSLKLGERLGRRHSFEALHRSNSPDFTGGRTSPQLSAAGLHRAVQSFSQSPSCGMALQYSQCSPGSLQVHVGSAFQRDAQVSERGACGEETAAHGVPTPHSNGLVSCAGAPGTSTPVRVVPSILPSHSARQSLHRSGAGSPTCLGRSLPAQLIRMVPSSQQR